MQRNLFLLISNTLESSLFFSSVHHSLKPYPCSSIRSFPHTPRAFAAEVPCSLQYGNSTHRSSQWTTLSVIEPGKTFSMAVCCMTRYTTAQNERLQHSLHFQGSMQLHGNGITCAVTYRNHTLLHKEWVRGEDTTLIVQRIRVTRLDRILVPTITQLIAGSDMTTMTPDRVSQIRNPFTALRYG